MSTELPPADRLKILQATDNYRPWYSLDDQRVCAVCMRTIDGRRIELRSNEGVTHCIAQRPDACPIFVTGFIITRPILRASLACTPNELSLREPVFSPAEGCRWKGFQSASLSWPAACRPEQAECSRSPHVLHWTPRALGSAGMLPRTSQHSAGVDATPRKLSRHQSTWASILDDP